MQVEDGEDCASAGRGEGGADAPAARARPSEHAAAPARPATADAIKEMMLALEKKPAQVTSVVLFNIGPVTPNRINGLFDSVKETEPHPYKLACTNIHSSHPQETPAGLSN